MNRALPICLLLGVATWLSLGAADAPKDTPLAGKTRTDKLKAKVSADFQNLMLRECFKELEGELQAQKLGSLSVTNSVGVSLNSRVTYKAKDKPLEEVLDEMLKPLDLGYVVVSKAGDRYDGWLRITKGNERGYEGAAEADPKETPKKEMPKKDPKKDPPTKEPDADAAEKAASSLLDIADTYVKLKKTALARKKLEELIEKYPDSESAKKAKAMLAEIEKKK